MVGINAGQTAESCNDGGDLSEIQSVSELNAILGNWTWFRCLYDERHLKWDNAILQ